MDAHWEALDAALGALERLEKENAQLRELADHRAGRIEVLREELAELRQELAEWAAHDCRRVALGYSAVVEQVDGYVVKVKP